jgi:formylglycine-generating enzyme required for sulfatase activity
MMAAFQCVKSKVATPQGSRGGSWNAIAGDCRSANRYFIPSDFRLDNLGFRLLRTAE